MANESKIIIGPGRLNFLHVFKPNAFQEGDKISDILIAHSETRHETAFIRVRSTISGELTFGNITSSSSIETNDFFQCGDASIVHVGGGLRDIPERRRLEAFAIAGLDPRRAAIELDADRQDERRIVHDALELH